jgi:phospholipid/cholesterol/gamma-HCH transport system substrate-binding protein
MKNSLETRLGIFVILAVIVAVFIIEMVGGLERFTRGHRMFAQFRSVQELKVGDRVKMAGVEVGRVEDITLSSNKVVVAMKIRRSAPVRTDSTATVQFTGLMGQNYVALDFGTPGGPLAENDTLLPSAEHPDLNALMSKLDNVAVGVENLTKSFTGDKIDNLLGPFTDFLKANQEPLTVAIANLQSISTQISKGQGTVGKMIYDDSLYNTSLNTVSNLQYATSEIKLTLDGAQHLIAQVNAGQGTLGKLMTDDALYNETTMSMQNLRGILQKINQGNGSVGKLVNDQEFYNNLKLTLQKVDKATEGLEDQGPLSVLGIAVNHLF